MIDITECDAVMIARGALGNPWIFKELSNYLKNEEYSFNPSLLAYCLPVVVIKVIASLILFSDKYTSLFGLNCLYYLFFDYSYPSSCFQV